MRSRFNSPLCDCWRPHLPYANGMFRSCRLTESLLALSLASVAGLQAADWPMWRHDAGRTAASAQVLPAELELKWVRQLPPLTPAYRDRRLQFDAGYEPIVLGDRLVVGSSYDNSVTAYACSDGGQLWKIYPDGAVRFAPVGGDGRIVFGSKDRHLYWLCPGRPEVCWGSFQGGPLGTVRGLGKRPV